MTAWGSATVGAGAQLIALYARLARRGLLVPAGSCPSVGIPELALGGRHGLSGPRFGLTSDNLLLAATIVTADGRRAASTWTRTRTCTGPAAAEAGGTSD